MHLQLAVPDLLWPDSSLKQAAPELPGLAQLLAKGRRRAMEARDMDSWLLEAFGVPEGGAASYALRADGGDPGDAMWLCADPCHLRVNRDTVVLADAYSFDLSREEAEALAQKLNEHFAPDGLSFYPMQPERWYVRLNEAAAIETTPLAQVRGKDIDPRLPRGPEAMRWRGFLNEAQMLLHQHPVNEAREARGELPINSVWLWGEGVSPTPKQRPFQRVRSRSALAAGLAQASGASVQALPDNAAQWLKSAVSEGVELIVLDELIAPACYGDLQAWQERLQKLEQNWFAPALAALRAGHIGMLSVHCMGAGGAFSAETTRQDLRYFWRRPKPFHVYANPV